MRRYCELCIYYAVLFIFHTFLGFFVVYNKNASKINRIFIRFLLIIYAKNLLLRKILV